MCGHIKTTKDRTKFLEFCRYLRTLYPAEVRIAIVMDNFSPHLSTRVDTRVGDWAGPTTLNWPTCRPTPAGSTGSRPSSRRSVTSPSMAPTTSHKEQASMIRRYIIWRKRNAQDKTLRELVKRGNVA